MCEKNKRILLKLYKTNITEDEFDEETEEEFKNYYNYYSLNRQIYYMMVGDDYTGYFSDSFDSNRDYDYYDCFEDLSDENYLDLTSESIIMQYHGDKEYRYLYEKKKNLKYLPKDGKLLIVKLRKHTYVIIPLNKDIITKLTQ